MSFLHEEFGKIIRGHRRLRLGELRAQLLQQAFIKYAALLEHLDQLLSGHLFLEPAANR
jgi:hypothetical protein